MTGPKSEDPQGRSQRPNPKAERERRLAAALKDNLRRRKAASADDPDDRSG